MPLAEDHKMTRIYVEKSVNDMIDMAHVRVMSHVGRKISKTEFIAKALELGLENEVALYDYYGSVDQMH